MIERIKIRNEELANFFKNRKKYQSKPWQLTEWRKRRKRVMKKECKQCGATENLVLHHLGTSSTIKIGRKGYTKNLVLRHSHLKANWHRLWNLIRNILFEKSNYYKEENYKVEVCPNCKSKNLYERKTIKPKYRCLGCYTEFEKPKKAIKNPRKTGEYWRDVDKFVKDERKKITKEFVRIYKEYWKKYLSLKNTVTLCRKCHFLWEKKRFVLCKKCGKKYHSAGREMCWNCIIETKGLKKCPECGKNWYNPSFGDKCQECQVRKFELETPCDSWG